MLELQIAYFMDEDLVETERLLILLIQQNQGRIKQTIVEGDDRVLAIQVNRLRVGDLLVALQQQFGRNTQLRIA
jgi:hypothetical protein